jgi:hypothetical protein
MNVVLPNSPTMSVTPVRNLASRLRYCTGGMKSPQLWGKCRCRGKKSTDSSYSDNLTHLYARCHSPTRTRDRPALHVDETVRWIPPQRYRISPSFGSLPPPPSSGPGTALLLCCWVVVVSLNEQSKSEFWRPCLILPHRACPGFAGIWPPRHQPPRLLRTCTNPFSPNRRPLRFAGSWENSGRLFVSLKSADGRRGQAIVYDKSFEEQRRGGLQWTVDGGGVRTAALASQLDL